MKMIFLKIIPKSKYHFMGYYLRVVGLTVVVGVDEPDFGGSTPVEKRMMRVMTRMTVVTMAAIQIVIFRFLHHILR